MRNEYSKSREKRDLWGFKCNGTLINYDGYDVL